MKERAKIEGLLIKCPTAGTNVRVDWDDLHLQVSIHRTDRGDQATVTVEVHCPCGEMHPVTYDTGFAWNVFFWDSNQAFGLVDSPETWAEIIGNLEKGQDPSTVINFLKEGKMAPSMRDCPKFGYRMECTEKTTLEDWAKQTGMYDALFGHLEKNDES